MGNLTLKQLLGKKQNKYRAKPIVHEGIRFASQKEGMYYLKLRNKHSIGEISYFLCQVPFRLPGPAKYLADFMVVYPDNRLEFIDVKGRDTAMSILKRKQVKDLYGVDVKIV